MKYFAYGSNMSLRRFQQRVHSAVPLGLYLLEEHELRFHKVGMDGSAKCNAFFTGHSSHLVRGLLYEFDASEKMALDVIEGLGFGYDDKMVSVLNPHGNVEMAVTYYATRIDDSLQPFTWYKKHLLVGARELDLPTEYVARIEALRALKDPDLKREAEQLAIYS